MAERRLIFPDDHPYHPGKTLVIPDGTSQEDLDAQIEELSKPPQEPQSNYPATIASAVPKAITNTLGSAASGAAYLGGLESPKTAIASDKVYKEKFKGPPKSWSDVWDRMTTGTGAAPEPPNPGFLTNRATDTLGLRTPQTPGEKIADSTTQGVVGSFLGGGVGGAIPRATVYGAIPGATSEYARQKTEGIKVPEAVPGIGGKDISPTVAAITSLFSSPVARKIATPNSIEPRRLINNQVIKNNMGGEQTAGQASGDKMQMRRELRADPDVNARQTDAFHERMTAPTGSPTPSITPEWLDQTGTNIGNTYDNLEKTTHIHLGHNPITGTGAKGYVLPEIVNIENRRPQDTKAILDTIYNTDKKFKPPPGSQDGEKIHDALFNSIGSRTITGEQYRRLRSNLYSEAENAGSNETAHSFRQVAKALDGAMARTKPEWGQAWNENNRKFANFRMAQVAANANKTKDQFNAKQWMTAGHRTMGPEDFANSESGRFADAYGKVMPELPSGEIPPSYAGATAGAALGSMAGYGAGLVAHKMGMPWLAEPSTAAILGATNAGLLGLLKGRSVLPQMSPAVQWWKKQQFAPATRDNSADRNAANRTRALFEGVKANQQ